MAFITFYNFVKPYIDYCYCTQVQLSRDFKRDKLAPRNILEKGLPKKDESIYGTKLC